MAIEGAGAYRTVGLNSATPTFTLMDLGPAGLQGVGRPTVNSGAVGTGTPTDDPNGAKGKITFAAPAFAPGDALKNTYYQSWLYAAVSEAGGDFNGLYLSKDAGGNWTKIQLMSDAAEPLFTHNNSGGVAGGNHSLALAVDPLNPAIVYLASDIIVRVDTTFLTRLQPVAVPAQQRRRGPDPALTTGGAQMDDRAFDDGIALTRPARRTTPAAACCRTTVPSNRTRSSAAHSMAPLTFFRGRAGVPAGQPVQVEPPEPGPTRTSRSSGTRR